MIMNVIKVNSNGRFYNINIRNDADESVAAEIFTEHEYRVADSVIKETNYPIIDLGAHAGFFSIYAKSLNPNVKIIAVEPEPNNIEQMKQNFHINNINDVKIFEGAVARDSGRRHLYLAKDSHNHRLLGREETKNKHSIVVNSWSLSELLKKCIINDVGVIKMDIEGGEYEVLESFTENDFKKVHSFLIEYHNENENICKIIENRLRENGFGVRIMPSKFDKKMGFIFAVNKRK